MKELDNTFSEISCVIDESRANAYRKINEELILMYREIGRFLSEKSKDATYGDSYVDSLAEYIQSQFPGINGCPPRSGRYSVFSGVAARYGNGAYAAR